jgi:hypothetical protein
MATLVGTGGLLPGFNGYQKRTSNYDAIPSGHVATFMATITVIATNYPEVKWIKPIGYKLMGIMAFETMSSKVHWVSDYPLGLFMGYVVGKTAARRRIVRKRTREPSASTYNTAFRTDFSMVHNHRYTGVGFTITF